MNAAPRYRAEAARGASRLLEHCATIGRLTAGERASARARLESELGCELARLLICALAGRQPPRAACLI